MYRQNPSSHIGIVDFKHFPRWLAALQIQKTPNKTSEQVATQLSGVE
jgi:hypothetical protein